MFTGLIAGVGLVASVQRLDDGARIEISSELARELSLGDSIAVNGVCLTANSATRGSFTAEVMNETLQRSSLGRLHAQARVNLELPLRASDRLGGHIVQGHVDGLGKVLEVVPDGFARRLVIAAPPEVIRYVVAKGSIAVDGVSLTVAGCDERSFTVSLIPETLDRTNLGAAQAGTLVNLEVDIVAKYVEKTVRHA